MACSYHPVNVISQSFPFLHRVVERKLDNIWVFEYIFVLPYYLVGNKKRYSHFHLKDEKLEFEKKFS